MTKERIGLYTSELLTSISVTAKLKEVQSILLHVRFLVTVWTTKESKLSQWKKMLCVIAAVQSSQNSRCFGAKDVSILSIVQKNAPSKIGQSTKRFVSYTEKILVTNKLI
mmetsp:Transcript_36489/g.40605  ORF Transcript_36489/g.40605 Transcript_36489/m.40605 type:complete len:110 (+) Transcript_36489:370-699(+)